MFDRINVLDVWKHLFDGALAQLGERLAGSQEVRGSIPLGSMIDWGHPVFLMVSLGCLAHKNA